MNLFILVVTFVCLVMFLIGACVGVYHIFMGQYPSQQAIKIMLIGGICFLAAITLTRLQEDYARQQAYFINEESRSWRR